MAEAKRKRRYIGIVGGLNLVTAKAYRIVKTSLIGRILTSYTKIERRTVGGDGELRSERMTSVRRGISGLLERSRAFDLLKSLVSVPLLCPVSVYGMFLLFYGISCAATYFLPIVIGINMWTGVGAAYAGGAFAVSSVPLLFSGSSLATAVLESGFFRDSEAAARHAELLSKYKLGSGVRWALGFLGALIGAGAGIASLFVGVPVIPIALLGIVAVCAAIKYPEAGIVTAFALLPMLILFDNGGIVLPILISAIWVGYLFKILLGKRLFRLDLCGICVALICAAVFASGFFSAGGTEAIVKSVRYTLMISAFFPVTSLMRNGKWTDRCLNAMMLTSLIAMLALIAVHFFEAQILGWASSAGFDFIVKMTRAVASAEITPERVSCFIILAFPAAALPIVRSNRSRSTAIVSAVTVMAFLVEAVVIPDVRCKTVMSLGVILFLVLYDHRIMSACILAAVPAVGAYSFFLGGSGTGNAFLRSAGGAFGKLFAFPDQRIVSAVASMIRDNPFGIGFGEQAFSSVYTAYAHTGFENASSTGGFWSTLVTSAGIAGGVIVAVTLILFMLNCLEFIRFNRNQHGETGVLALFVGILSLVIYGIRVWIWQSDAICFMFWAMIAICSSYIRNGRDADSRALGNRDPTGFSSDITMIQA